MKHLLPIIILLFVGLVGKGQNIKAGAEAGTGPYYIGRADTVKVMMLCCDISQQNGYRSSKVFWQFGFVVRELNKPPIYLDETKKKQLQPNIVVWATKPFQDNH